MSFEKQWFVYFRDHHEGPFSSHEIHEFVENGRVLDSTYLWKEGLADWMMKSDIPEFHVGQGEGHDRPAFLLPNDQIYPRQTEPFLDSAADTKTHSDTNANTHRQDLKIYRSDQFLVKSPRGYLGPFSYDQIQKQITRGKLTAHSELWKRGWNDFTEVQNLQDFASSLSLSSKKTPSILSKALQRLTHFLIIALSLGTLYQGLAIINELGYLQKTPLEALSLKPLPLEKWIPVSKIQKFALERLPASFHQYVVPLDALNSRALRPEDEKMIRLILTSDEKADGLQAHLVLVPTPNAQPKFLLASNGSSSTSLEIQLRSMPSETLNLTQQNLTKEFALTKNSLTEITPFQGIELAPGNYEVTLRKLGTPKILFESIVFIGGTKDSSFQNKLLELNEKKKIDFENAQKIHQYLKTYFSEVQSLLRTAKTPTELKNGFKKLKENQATASLETQSIIDQDHIFILLFDQLRQISLFFEDMEASIAKSSKKIPSPETLLEPLDKRLKILDDELKKQETSSL